MPREAEKIRADADRQREVILADAYREAQRIKGEGDAKASAIYAQAFGQNPEFYAFYRSLEAYRASFRNKSDVMVLEPNSEFFKYLKRPRQGQQVARTESPGMPSTFLVAFALMLVHRRHAAVPGARRSGARPSAASPS